MANYPIKYVTDENGNRCLPKSHINAITNDNGTSLTNLLNLKVSIELIVITGTNVTQNLQPNKYYSFGEVTNLIITLESPINGVNNEYIFEFDSGNTSTILTLPSNIEGIEESRISKNAHYEISIKYSPNSQKYYGLLSKWELL